VRIEPFTNRRIHFLGEQDGPPEQDLKRQLSDYLGCEHQIKRAYLVQIAHDTTSTPKVALCLVGEQTNIRQVVQCVGTIFKELFPTAESIEVLFLNELQKTEVNLVARPFYVSDGADSCRPN
jgi:hypothetical protein